jgi:hypothetical protein
MLHETTSASAQWNAAGSSIHRFNSIKILMNISVKQTKLFAVSHHQLTLGHASQKKFQQAATQTGSSLFSKKSLVFLYYKSIPRKLQRSSLLLNGDSIQR